MSSTEYDPYTGLPRKKSVKQPAYTQQQVNLSLAQNPQGTFGPSPQVDYGFGTLGVPRLPGMPNYRDLIDNHPTYQQAKLDFGAQGVADAAQRAALTQRALIQFGATPDFNQLPGLNPEYLNQDVTPETRQLAQQNTDAGLSIAARQAKAFKDQIRAIKNALAARGALRSGETGHALQEAQLGYDQARFDTTNEILEFLAGLQAGYAERQRLAARELGNVATGVERDVREQYPGQAGVYGSPPQTPQGGAKGNTGDSSPRTLEELLERLSGGSAFTNYAL